MIKKIAIVTGGNKGIGLNITKSLIEASYHVIVGGRTSIKIDKKYSDSYTFIQGDLTY